MYRSFVAIAQTGALSRAAQQLSCSTAAVSRQLDALESQLGARLFDRTTRRLQLSDAGLRLLPRAEALLQALEDAQTSIDVRRVQATVKVCAPIALGIECVGPSLAGMAHTHPGTRVELLLDNGATDALAQGVDVLVRAKLRDRDDPADLVVRSVGSFGLGLYARADLARRVGDPDTAAHWEDLPWIGHLGYGRAADLRLRQGERECVLKMRPWIWANDVMALIRLVEHGAGFAVLPLRLAQPAVAAGRMQAVLADWAFPRVPLCLAWRNRGANRHAVAAVASHLRVCLADYCVDPDTGLAAHRASTAAAAGN